MSPSVVFTPEAEDQFAELYRYIAAAGTFVDATWVHVTLRGNTRW